MVDLSSNISSLFVLYLIVSANWLGPVLSCKVRHLLDTSMIVRHFLGYLTMCFFVVLANQSDPLPIAQLFGISAGLYFWFMLSSKMDIYTWVLFMICIGSVYVLHIYENNTKENEQVEQSKLDQISLTKKILTYAALAVTLFGVLLYYGEKRIEYGNQFNPIRFILGNPVCKQKSPNATIVEKFTAVFKA